MILYFDPWHLGEAVYMDDIPTLPGELHGAFVQTKYAKAKLKSADASEALVSLAILCSLEII